MSNPQTLKGKPFGPFHQFRIDVETLSNGQTQATGFDAGKPGEKASAFMLVVNPDRETAYLECLQLVKNSPEWAEAIRLED